MDTLQISTQVVQLFLYSTNGDQMNELHWCLLNLHVKSRFKLAINYSSMGGTVFQHKITANAVSWKSWNSSGPHIFAQDTGSIVHQYR